MLDKLFPNWYFKNKIYPIFINQIQTCYANNKAIFLFEINDNELILSCIFNDKMTIFVKNKNKNIFLKNYHLNENFDIFFESLHNKSENIVNFKDFILLLKEKGEMVDSAQIIDFINSNFKGMINYYNFTRKEVEIIYKTIINDNIYFYQSNPKSIVLQTSLNKWID